MPLFHPVFLSEYEGNVGRLLFSTQAVSYTHLDVYKRQDLWEAFLHQHEVNTPVDAKTVEELRLEYPNEDLSICLLYTSRCV